MLSIQLWLQATLVSWVILSTPMLARAVVAQTQPDGLPTLPTNPSALPTNLPTDLPTAPTETVPTESRPESSTEPETIHNKLPNRSADDSAENSAENPAENSAAASVVEMTLPDLLNIVIQGNRDIQNELLERVVQRQTLSEAESRFNPQFTPSFSIQAERNGQTSFEPSIGAESSTTLTQTLEVVSKLRTPIGTDISLSVAPLSDTSQINLTINQPLLRGGGQSVNRAPIQQARIAESNNLLALRQTVIETVTRSINQYTTLAERQEAVIIQMQALTRRRQKFEQVDALVEAGRRARVDLIDSERSIAEAELALQEAQNELAQSNTDLLNLVGAETALQFVAPENAIAQLFEAAALRMNQFQIDQLVELAYQRRPDYQRAKADLELGDINLLLAQDDQRWNLNWGSSARLGNDSSQVTTGLTLSRTLGDESLDTAVIRSQTSLLQQQNRLAQLTETIRNEITDQLRNVRSGLAQVELAQRATAAAELQLQVTQEKFKLGRDDITLFEITDQEDTLVAAQNQELRARIGFLNSMASLEQAVGITLETWQPWVDFNVVLAEEALPQTD